MDTPEIPAPGESVRLRSRLSWAMHAELVSNLNNKVLIASEDHTAF